MSLYLLFPTDQDATTPHSISMQFMIKWKKKMRSKHPGLPYPSAIPPLYYILALNMKAFFFFLQISLVPQDGDQFAFTLSKPKMHKPAQKNQYPQGMKNSIRNQSITCFSGPGKYSKGHPFNPLHGRSFSGISRSRLTAKDCQKGVNRSRIIISGRGAR